MLLPCVLSAQNKTDEVKQNFKESKFEAGISGGPSLNRFTKGQPQTGSNTGFTAGLSLAYQLSKHLSLQVEASILQQGGQLISFKDDTRIGLPESFSTKNVKNSLVTLTGLELPLLISYHLPIQQTWQPAFYAGASYIYNFNATDRYQKTGNLLTGEDVIATVSDHQNVSSVYTTNRANFVAGVKVKLPLFASVKMLIDFRYSAGLSAARQHYSYIEKIGFGSDIYANSFIAKVGFVLPL
ncbi:hypothetical protein A0256_04695 [Mucilaginibacter sp. PAMC 26640]|nr:hypothetical protein A0256_04695 [Mucilaginibacter sp. PAMC 26640]